MGSLFFFCTVMTVMRIFTNTILFILISCNSNIIFKKDSKFIDETSINNNEKKGIYGDIYKYEQDGVKNKILNNENNLEGVDIYLRTYQIVIAVSHKKEIN